MTLLELRATLERERARWMKGERNDHPQGLCGAASFDDPHQPARFDLKAQVFHGTYEDYVRACG